MAVDMNEIVSDAEKMGKKLAEHPAVAKYRDAQRAVQDDPETTRTMSELNRQLENLARQQQAGMPVTDAQRQQLESLESRIVSNIKVKALSMAEVEFIDILRRVVQAIQRPVMEAAGGSRLAQQAQAQMQGQRPA